MLALAVLSKAQKVNKFVGNSITKLLARLQVSCFQLQDKFKFAGKTEAKNLNNDSIDFSRFLKIPNQNEVVERAVRECKPVHDVPERTVDAKNLVGFIEKNKDYPSGDKVVANIRSVRRNVS